jgi:hypothetical protein
VSSKTQEILAIEDKYGLVLFKMGLTHLVDVGIRHLTDEYVKEAVEQITADGEADKAKGVSPIITAEFQCAIIRCASELTKFSPWELFAYIKEHIYIANQGGKND